MIINPYVYASAPAFDPDAQAFITAAGITDPTQQSAINTLVLDMKGYGIWTKMKAIYPMVGGTATTHKYNLKDPQDLDAAFRLVFNGGWTHSSTGALPNGTNGYADTFLGTNAMSLNSAHFSYYSRTNLINGTARVEMGVLKSIPNSYSDLHISGIANTVARMNNSTTYDSTTILNSTGFFINTRTASNIIKIYRNNTAILNGTASSSATTSYSIFIGAQNSVGSGTVNNPVSYTFRECAFASIGDGLTGTEAANFYTAVNAYQVALSRNV